MTDEFIVNAFPDGVEPLPIYFNTCCMRFNEHGISSPCGRGFSQILWVAHGEGELECKGERHILKRGSAFYISSDCPHEYHSTDGLQTTFLTVVGEYADAVARHYGIDGFAYYDGFSSPMYDAALGGIIAEFSERRRQGVLSSLAYSLFVNFFEEKARESLENIDKTALFIEKNFNKKLTLEKLAAVNDSSVSKLCHDFKAKFGCTVFRRILDLRLSYAHNYLCATQDVKTKDAAFSAGFEDVSYFCRAYREKYGVTPEVKISIF